MRRLFIAVDLSIAVVERLVMFQSELRDRIESTFGESVRLRGVDAPNIHITLKFLGDTAPELVGRIEEKLVAMCDPLFPFEVACQGVGAFPERSRPRIIWAGIDEEGARVLGLLQRNLEQELSELGIDEDRRDYHPHVTLGRIKSREAPCFVDLLKPYREVGFGESFIKDIVLYESHLDHHGPRYEVLRRFALGAD